MEPLFPDLPALTELDDDALQAELDRIKETADKIAAGDEATIGELTDAELEEALDKAADQAESIRAEQAERETQAEETEKSVNEKLARIKGESSDEATDETDEDADAEATSEEDDSEEVEGEVVNEDDETEELAASGGVQRNTRAVIRRRFAPARTADRDPAEKSDPDGITRTLVASNGQELENEYEVARALSEARMRLRQPTVKGVREKVPVASILLDFPEDMTLTAAAGEMENTRKINAVIEQATAPEALVAGGGICAPVTPYYELMDFGVTDRPVRDAFPRFGADRGGIRFATPLQLSDINNAVWYRTAAQDAALYVGSLPTAGATPDKTVQRVICPGFNEVQVAMIGTSIIVGNLPQRTFPELIQHFQRLVAQAAARVAEGKLLDRLAATAKTPATPPVQQLGLVDYVAFILRQAAAMRSRARMSDAQRLRLVAPRWLEEAWDIDQIRGNRFVRDEIEALLGEANISVTWHLDTENAGGQIMAAQATGASTHWVDFPSTAISYLYPEGSYLYLDGGQIDLGLILDSTLAKTNDVEFFAESFEELAFLGTESLRLVTPVCPSGASANGVTFNCALADRM